MADAIGIAVDFLFSYAVLRIYMQNDPRKVRMRAILLAGGLVGLSEALSLLYIPPLATGFTLFTSYGVQLGGGAIVSGGAVWMVAYDSG